MKNASFSQSVYHPPLKISLIQLSKTKVWGGMQPTHIRIYFNPRIDGDASLQNPHITSKFVAPSSLCRDANPLSPCSFHKCVRVSVSSPGHRCRAFVAYNEAALVVHSRRSQCSQWQKLKCTLPFSKNTITKRMMMMMVLDVPSIKRKRNGMNDRRNASPLLPVVSRRGVLGAPLLF